MNLNVLDLWFNLFPLHASYILLLNAEISQLSQNKIRVEILGYLVDGLNILFHVNL